MIKLAASIIVTACSLTGCAVNDGYGYNNQGGYSAEERSYRTSYGGTTWYREEVPYYPNYDRNHNGVADNREIDRNRNGIPDYREVDRNRNGVPDNREVDRNHNGVPDQREQDRNHNGIPDNKEVDRNKDGKPDRPNFSHDGYKSPDNKSTRPNNNYGDRNGNVYGR